jgi:hypothetical protein
MKKMIVLSAFAAFISLNCSAQTNTSSNTSGNTYSDEATYKLDQRLSNAGTSTTDCNGAMGAGTGGSYASTYCRSSAYKRAKAKAAATTTVTPAATNP